MIHYVKGNILNSLCQALVVPVKKSRAILESIKELDKQLVTDFARLQLQTYVFTHCY